MNEEEYRKALKHDAILDFSLGLIRMIGTELESHRVQDTIKPMIETVVNRLEDIDRADFGDNFNAAHGEEQGVPF